MGVEMYTDYINEHINNVKLIWYNFKDLNATYNLKSEKINYLINCHDLSKFSNEEYEGYRLKFYPEKNEEKNEEKNDLIFKHAWNHHQKSNPHHWQYWVMWKNKESIALEMDYEYVIEMLCDWSAMSLKFKDYPSNFYNKNKNNMLLHKNTIVLIEGLLLNFNRVVEILNDRNS